MSQAASEQSRRWAVIYNPTKVSDQFRQLVTNRLERDSWADTLWLETSADDPGRGMTKEAVAAQVDLVIGAGGDGTVRVVADGLAGSGIPMGLVPAGTANLLARNLDLPLEEDAAVEIAFAGHTRTIDLIKLTVDDHPPEHFAVIAGIGVDAMIMDETDSGLKRRDRLRCVLPRCRQRVGQDADPLNRATRPPPPGQATRHDLRDRERGKAGRQRHAHPPGST
jgi:diacylglycerol kinase (ATP)